MRSISHPSARGVAGTTDPEDGPVGPSLQPPLLRGLVAMQVEQQRRQSDPQCSISRNFFEIRQIQFCRHLLMLTLHSRRRCHPMRWHLRVYTAAKKKVFLSPSRVKMNLFQCASETQEGEMPIKPGSELSCSPRPFRVQEHRVSRRKEHENDRFLKT